MLQIDIVVDIATATSVSGVKQRIRLDLVRVTGATPTVFLALVVSLHLLAVTDHFVDLAVTVV
tara:strand:- start:895 stop:1083 length:189 start_codon:yes stop_codon:yes gene_type:complete